MHASGDSRVTHTIVRSRSFPLLLYPNRAPSARNSAPHFRGVRSVALCTSCQCSFFPMNSPNPRLKSRNNPALLVPNLSTLPSRPPLPKMSQASAGSSLRKLSMLISPMTSFTRHASEGNVRRRGCVLRACVLVRLNVCGLVDSSVDVSGCISSSACLLQGLCWYVCMCMRKDICVYEAKHVKVLITNQRRFCAHICTHTSARPTLTGPPRTRIRPGHPRGKTRCSPSFRGSWVG